MRAARQRKVALVILLLATCGCQSVPQSVPTPVATPRAAASPATPPREFEISAYCVSEQGDSLFLGCTDGLRQLDLQSGKVQVFYPMQVAPLSVMVDCDGEVRLLDCDFDKLRLTQLRNGRCQSRVLLKQPAVHLVRLDAGRVTMPILAWNTDKSQVEFWRFEDGNLLAGAIPFDKFSPLDIVVSWDKGTVRLFPSKGEAVEISLGFADSEAAPPEPPLPDVIKSNGRVSDYVMSSDRRWVAVADEQSVRIFDPEDWHVVTTLPTSTQGEHRVSLAGQDLLVREPVGFSVWSPGKWNKRFWCRHAWDADASVKLTGAGYLAVNKKKAVLRDRSDGHCLWEFPRKDIVAWKPGARTTLAQARRLAGAWYPVAHTHAWVPGDSEARPTSVLLFCVRPGSLHLNTWLTPGRAQPVRLQLPLSGHVVDFDVQERFFVGDGQAQLDSGRVRMRFEHEDSFHPVNLWKDCEITLARDVLKFSFLDKTGARAVNTYRRFDGLSMTNYVLSRREDFSSLHDLERARAVRRAGQVHIEFDAQPGVGQPATLEIVCHSVGAIPEDRLTFRVRGGKEFDGSGRVRMYEDACGHEYVWLESTSHSSHFEDVEYHFRVCCPLEGRGE